MSSKFWWCARILTNKIPWVCDSLFHINYLYFHCCSHMFSELSPCLINYIKLLYSKLYFTLLHINWQKSYRKRKAIFVINEFKLICSVFFVLIISNKNCFIKVFNNNDTILHVLVYKLTVKDCVLAHFA